MIERAVDFARLRHMRCGACGHEWDVSGEWLARFDRAEEACQECGTDCQGEDRPDFHVTADDPAHDDDATRAMYWYHSSTEGKWPNREFDPATHLAGAAKRRMARWTRRQKAKALHVGTYEAAIENLFRRIDDQSGSSEQFFLYRVRLREDSVIEKGVHPEPTDSFGDALLAEVASPGVNVYRYVNVHEDASSVSLAIEVDAIDAVQQIAVPLPVDASDPWIAYATERLRAATSITPTPTTERLTRWRLPRPSAFSSQSRAIVDELASDLPLPLRDRFRIDVGRDAFLMAPCAFPAKALGLARLVTNPHAVLTALNESPWRAM